MNAANGNRPLEGKLLRDALHELAMITAVADSLRLSLGPLTEEDKAAGAEPLTNEQIQEDLEKITHIATKVAIHHLHALPQEWYAANEAIS